MIGFNDAPQAMQAFASVLQNKRDSLTRLQNYLSRNVHMVALDRGRESSTETPEKVVSLLKSLVLPNSGGGLKIERLGNNRWAIEAYISNHPTGNRVVTAECTLKDNKITKIALESTPGTYTFIL